MKLQNWHVWVIASLIAIGARIVHAAPSEAVRPVEYEQYYLDSSGNRVTPSDAILGAVRGEKMVKCQTVEAKISKAGTSIGVRNVKKPKAGDQ